MKTAVAAVLLSFGCADHPAGIPVNLPDGPPGIGFDDLRYSATLHRLLVPSGRSGRLNLIEPNTLAVTSISGFSEIPDYSGGHDDGPTSVDEGAGKLYVTDRTSGQLLVVDPATNSIVASAPLAAHPDYVRFVQVTNELWITEPGNDQLEILKIGADGIPTHDAVIAVQNGPESLVIDEQRGRAYTHRWQKTTVAIDVNTRAIVAEWSNGCAASRGIALDAAHGFLFSGCNEGTAATLDVANDGKIVSTLARGSGFDVIGYSEPLGHLYLAGGSCQCLVMLGVGRGGALSFLNRVEAPASTHCAAADDVGHAWVCDPDGGRLFRVDDGAPRTLP